MKLGSSSDCNTPLKSDRESAPGHPGSGCSPCLNLDHLCERDRNFAIEVALGMAADADWTKIREHANGGWVLITTTEIQDRYRRKAAERWIKYGRDN